MIVRIGMAPRLPGVTPPTFQEHWRTAHAEAAGAIPGIRSYVQNHAVLSNGWPLLPYPGFDACSEIAFDDVAAMAAGFASEHYQSAVRADEARFVDKDRFSLVLTAPDVVLDRREVEDPVKLLTFWRAHPARGPESLSRAAGHWAAAVAGDERVTRHERLTVLHAEHDGRDAPAADLVDVLFFADLDAALEHLGGDVAHEAAWHMAGAAFGAAHHLARPRVVV